MSNKVKGLIGVFVVVAIIACVGMGVLRWGEVIYRTSDGERGWSLGPTLYGALGWDDEAYTEDFGRRDDPELADDGHVALWHVHGRGGRSFYHGFTGGLFGLIPLAVGIGVVVFLIARRRQGQAKAADPEQ